MGGFPQSFLQYMDAHPDLRTMIDEGRGKLEWERKIPDEKLEELKTLLAAEDFKTNCPRSSSASMNCPGTCSETCPEDTTRTTPCTSSLPRLGLRSCLPTSPSTLRRNVDH